MIGLGKQSRTLEFKYLGQRGRRKKEKENKERVEVREKIERKRKTK